MIIPILPCPDIKAQVKFYEQLGFEVLGVYTSPNPYAALKFEQMELHFYGTKQIPPDHNSSMCFIRVKDVDAVCQAFSTAMKQSLGRVPRSGVPKISKVRDLADDRRFTLTDPGGNTFYIGSPDQQRFFRTIQQQEVSKQFTALYDVAYSKEDDAMAFKMLLKYESLKNQLTGLDKAKFLLLELDVYRKTGQEYHPTELVALLQGNNQDLGDWRRIAERFEEIIEEDE